MKTILPDYSAGGSIASWHFLPDSALVNSGKPFFIPDFADSFAVVLTPVLKLSKMGKSIAAKFAPRYFGEIAPGVHFLSPGLRLALLESGLPPDRAYAFDRSMTVGAFREITGPDAADTFRLLLNGKTVTETTAGDIALSGASLLEAVSPFNTVKTGDFLALPFGPETPVSIGDRVSVEINDSQAFFIDIK